tara:strand:+ start:248 stop:673 length:426 start_codon:yes stop_codon:yes gene_type:complete
METLTPYILDVRNSFLEQFKNEQLETISKKLDQLFDVEKDPVIRIVILASRVDTIRKRIDEICNDEVKEIKIEKPPEEKKDVSSASTEENSKENSSESWIRVIMKESTEVNGVRFPEGIQIDVTEEDSKKLIDSGKAAIIT